MIATRCAQTYVGEPTFVAVKDGGKNGNQNRYITGMSLDRVLALLGVLLGIPGSGALFHIECHSRRHGGNLGRAPLGRGLLYTSIIRSSALLVLRRGGHTNVCELRKEGRSAEELQRIRPNHSYLRQMEHKNIAADGNITNICWNNTPINQANISRKLGKYVVRVDFPVAPKLWATFDGALSYELEDCFGSSNEGIVYCVDFPTKSAKIIVMFPPNRRCKKAQARKLHGAGELVLDDPTISPSGDKLELTIRHPTLGANYSVYWEW